MEVWYRAKQFEIIFPWILGAILVVGTFWSISGNFMLKYMGVFFIFFGLAKTFDWGGFVKAFREYDLLAKRFDSYAWIYPGLELVLGFLFFSEIFVLGAAWVTLVITGVGAIGVGQKLLRKEKFQCACLGTKINVPLTKATLLENVLMFIMAGMVLFT